jgi:hypothetical protein
MAVQQIITFAIYELKSFVATSTGFSVSLRTRFAIVARADAAVSLFNKSIYTTFTKCWICCIIKEYCNLNKV